jgi:hypothetical protein
VWVWVHAVKKKNKEGRCEFVFEKEVCACVYKNIGVCVCCTDRECLQRKKWVCVRALAADSQPFSLNLGNKTTFCFLIKKHPAIDSLNFPYIN